MSKRARIGVGVGAGLVVLTGGAWVAGHYAAGDALPRHAVIEGVAVGGLTPAAAQDELAAALAERAAAPLTITARDQSLTVAPAEAGLTVDVAASVAGAGGGRSWNPVTIATVLFGGGPTSAVVAVDQAQLDATISSLAEQVDVLPVDAVVTYKGLKPRRSEAVDGVALDRAGTAEAVRTAFLHRSDVAAPVGPAEPAVTTAEADAVVTGLAAVAVSAPVDVHVAGEGTVRLPAEAIAASLRFEAVDGEPAPVFDPDELDAQLAAPLKELGLKQPKDATITIRKSGRPKVVASVDGVGVDPEKLASALVPVLGQYSDRRVSVAVSPREAAFTTADAKALGVEEVVGKFTTYFPGTAYRYNNIGKAARLVNGTFLRPGEVFSMNATLGKRTRAAGWMAGGAIDGGRIVERLGGGISQATTTVFNAIFFAGLEDIYHKPHSLYFSRYPVGREATLDWESVDMKFRNDSDYGVVLQAWITGQPGRTGSVTVRVWSTKRYTIKTTTPVRSNYRAPGKTIYDDSPGCVPQSAMSGFDVKFQRLFYQGKKLVRREPFSWSYNSLTPVVCGKKPKD